MKPVFVLAVLAFFANVQACFGDFIFTVTPTNRIDNATQSVITYSVKGAADIGTQNIGAYFVRVQFPFALYPAGSLSGVSGVTRAPDSSPLGQSATGPFTFVSVSPGPNAVRWQTNELVSSTTNVTIDTVGALIGTFDLTWNRPNTGQYDAAIAAAQLAGSAYKVAPFAADSPFIDGQLRAGLGVSTIIAVPEPNSMQLVGLVALCGAGATWLRRRSLPKRMDLA